MRKKESVCDCIFVTPRLIDEKKGIIRMQFIRRSLRPNSSFRRFFLDFNVDTRVLFFVIPKRTDALTLYFKDKAIFHKGTLIFVCRIKQAS